ncbi:hypothetical protein [Pseudomonas sp. MPR-R5A]|uniref:hypothetical protein n=1 Tax=Pseudomonas sp. MPR-R5A TaxID=2070626 RepID=UPI0021139B84|nr:hypothetical protein [Pseudomonas sp. MPR-R5A]
MRALGGVGTVLYLGKGLVHARLRAQGQAAEVDPLYRCLFQYLHGERLTPV